MVLRVIPVVLAFLLLGAHFLREGNAALVLVCVFAPFLLLVKKRWSFLLVRVLLLLSALVWLRTMIALVQYRVESGAPWLRMVLILAGVTAFTLFAAHGLGSERVKKRYP